LKLVGLGDFGIPHIISGLTIELIWNDGDDEFQETIDLLKTLILDKIIEKTVDGKTYKVLQNSKGLWFRQQVIYKDKIHFVSRVEEKYVVLDFKISANPTEIYKIIEEL
jgi:hypothetical protein